MDAKHSVERGGKVLAGDPEKKLRWQRDRVISIRRGNNELQIETHWQSRQLTRGTDAVSLDLSCWEFGWLPCL
jgi:hypothetical protein